MKIIAMEQRLTIWHRIVNCMPILFGMAFVSVLSLLAAGAAKSAKLGDQPTPAPFIQLPISEATVKDGDTLQILVSLSFPLRCTGIDTPELRDSRQKAAAEVSKQFTEDWIRQAAEKKQPIAVRLYGLGIYGRIEGDMVNMSTGQRLGNWLIEQGVAVPSTGKRHEWTDAELREIELKANHSGDQDVIKKGSQQWKANNRVNLYQPSSVLSSTN